MPAGVAARMANASAMHLAGSANTTTTDAPALSGRNRGAPPAHGQAPAPPVGPRLRRALLLIGTGVLAGLVLVVGVVLVSMPAANNGLSSQKPSVAGTQAFAPVSTPARASVAAAAPTVEAAPAKPTAAPAVATAVRLATAAPTATATSVGQSPGAPAAGQSQGTTPGQPQGTAPGQSQGTTPATSAGQPQGATVAGQPQGAAAAPGQPLLDVRFVSGPGRGWLDSPSIAGWSDGAYRLQARQPARFVAIAAPIPQPLSDVVVTATFRKTAGPPGGGYGLIIRDQGPLPRDGVSQALNAFVLEAGDLGEFGIWRRDGDHWIDLVAWTRSAAVRQGGSPNDLTVRAVGNRLTFTINGTQVASVEDAAPMAGGAGVFIGGDYNEVAVDRFTVQVAD
jgi:hypothetical protein